MGLFSKWKPKTIAGKIIKGATIGVGVATVAATGIGAVAGVVGGGGLLAGAIAGGQTVVKAVKGVAGGVAKGVATVTSKVAGSAKNLITGMNKEQQEIIKDAKQEAKEARKRNDLYQKLLKIGKSESEARRLAGIQDAESQSATETGVFGLLDSLRGETNLPGNNIPVDNKKLLYAGAGLLALLFLPKLLK